MIQDKMKQFSLNINRVLGLFLMMISTTGFADTGYIQHKIINNTPYELYVGVRQQFQYPIQSCLGPIASGAVKECEGSFDKKSSSFVVELIKSTSPAEELRGTASLKTALYQNVFLTWTLKLDDKKELSVSIKTENSVPKWVSLTTLTQ